MSDVECVEYISGLNVRSEEKGVIKNDFWFLVGGVVASIQRWEDWEEHIWVCTWQVVGESRPLF